MPPKPEEVRLNELGQMAARGEYASGITAATLAAAKSAIYEDQVPFNGELEIHTHPIAC
jgi:hypothetical protein